MNFSDHWRSLWTIASVPTSPNLISGKESASLGPLLFKRSPLSRVILASSSLDLRIPGTLPQSTFNDIQSLFSCPSHGFFLSNADQYNVATDIVNSLYSAGGRADFLSHNNLQALSCCDGSTLLLFFPTGDNADEIGFLSLCFNGENLKPDVGVDIGGDIFKQRDGFKFSHQRIVKMSVASAQAKSSLPTSKFITEGFLLVTTLYSVNWFSIETRVLDDGAVRPLLTPLANQGFSSCVVDACWSPHFLQESAVLLESGELLQFNLINQSFDSHIVPSESNGDLEGWLGCQFGGQPWVILVASSTAVVLIDLRVNKKPKILARLKLPDFLGVASAKEKDKFLAFCRAHYSNFHFCTVTERLLLLFDIREPLVPVLSWVHGLNCPNFISMFRLSELRPSDEFNLASESGFMILVGSFQKNEFKLFCYGSSDRGALGSPLYAWELPSSISLSNGQWHSPDELVREVMFKETIPNQEMLLRKEGVIGFCIVPNSLLKFRPEPSGFVLIRLMLSGKLEIQEYHTFYYDSLSANPICEGADRQKAENFTAYNVHEGGNVSSRYLFFKLSCLYTYMRGSISIMLTNLYSELIGNANVHKPFYDDLSKLLSSQVQYPNMPLSNFIFDTSIPTSVFEIASRRLLASLKPNILSVAFTKYDELFTGQSETSFLPLEFPNCLPHHRITPFFVNIPANRSENLSSRVLAPEAIVGPILPLPVLLVLHQMDLDMTQPSIKEELADDLLNTECNDIFEKVLSVTSIADSGGFNESEASPDSVNNRQFFVCRPALRGCTASPNKEKTQMDKFSEDSVPHISLNYEKFTTFICGISDKNCKVDCGHQADNSEYFEFNPLKLDFEPLDIMLEATEQKTLESLKRHASSWLEKNKAYQDFFTSSNI